MFLGPTADLLESREPGTACVCELVGDRERRAVVDGAADEPHARQLTEAIGENGVAFPVHRGSTVISPTVRAVWADLVHFDIGVFLELPGPSRAVVLGTARANIVHDDRTYLALRVDVIGVIDLTANTVAFDAVLIDSHLLSTLDLTGGAAFRLASGGSPYAVFSVGGLAN